jgi:deoxyribose-phosphate aldolase
MGKQLSVADIAVMCDHSLLRPNLTDQEFDEGIEIVKKYQCKTVMVAPYDVQKAVLKLGNSPVQVSTVIDFPHGSNLTQSKVYEANVAISNGAKHLDMVIAISRAISDHFEEVKDDIFAVVETGHAKGIPVKVILETCFLSDRQIVETCKVAEIAGADYVKTSTGYGSGGAKLKDVQLMYQSVSEKVLVKAAGGIRTLDQVLEYRKAGAVMIGSRSTGEILDEAARRDARGELTDLD